MDTLRIEAGEHTPMVLLDQVDNRFEITGKSVPEHEVTFYQPLLDWLKEYKQKPNARTEFNLRMTYFNTISSKMIMDILLILEEMAEEGHMVVVNWHSPQNDEDMQEAGRVYEEMIKVPFKHLTYET